MRRMQGNEFAYLTRIKENQEATFNDAGRARMEKIHRARQRLITVELEDTDFRKRSPRKRSNHMPVTKEEFHVARTRR